MIDSMEKLLDKMDKQLEISNKTLNEIKRLGDVTAVKMDNMGVEIKDLKTKVAALDKQQHEMDVRCNVEHRGLERRGQSAEGIISKYALSGWKIVVGAVLGGLGMMIADRLFFIK